MAVNATTTLESQDVGLIFVREYYTFLNKKPNRLHAFYNKDSLFVRGDEGTVTTTVQGQEEIRKKIEECHFEDCKVLVTQVDSQVSANNGILIQVLGEMCNQNGPSQKFSQTFFLATQPNGYFVLNDIFRFLKDEVEIDYYTCEQKEQESVVIDIAPSPVPSSPIVEPQVKEEVKEPEVKKEIEEPEVKEPEVEVVEPEVKKVVVEPVKEEIVEEKKKKSEPKPQQQKKEQKKENKTTTKTWATLAATNGAATTAEKSNTTPSSPVVNEKSLNNVSTPPPTTTTATTPTQPQQPQQPQQQNQQNQQNKNQPSRNNNNNNNNNNNAHPRELVNIFVKLVTDNISEDQLQEAFNKIGPVKQCSINRQKACAFIEFYTPEATTKALAQHKVIVGNNTVHAEERRFGQANNNRYNQRNNQQQTYDRRTNNTNNRRGGGTTQSRINQGKGRGVPNNTK